MRVCYLLMHSKTPSLVDFNADLPTEENTPLVCRNTSVVSDFCDFSLVA